MVHGLIERIDHWIASKRPEYYAQLQPGATDDELNGFEARFSLRLPRLFRELYHWRDGQDPDCTASLQENWMFSSLEAIAEAKEMLDGMIGTDFEDPEWWRMGWIPYLANGGGDHLCLDLTAEDEGEPGQLLTFWHDWEDRTIKFPDFEAWLQHLVDSMEAQDLESGQDA